MANVFIKEDFKKRLQEHGILLNETQELQFKQYAKMLVEWNEKMNLTAITEENVVYEKHFLDSILPSFDVVIQGSLCDVGAGAGFPSIPLNIIYPSLQVTIVEPLGKRITFLSALCKELGLSVDLVNERAEDYAKNHRESFDIVTARAVANLPMLCELCIPLVKKEGTFIAMKGANGVEELEAAKQAISILGCELQDAFQKELSDGSIRMNFVFHKKKETAKKYPRPFAQIKKHPL